MAKQPKSIAIIFQDLDGHYYVSPDALDYMDSSGAGYRTKADALRAAAECGFTHACGSGTYWHGTRRIPARYWPRYY